MLFRRADHAGIRRGEITMTYRRWKRAAARPGGRHRLDAGGVVEVIAVAMIDETAITDEDARASGFADRAALLRQLARHAGEATHIYEVRFRYVADADKRAHLAADDNLTEEDVGTILARLARMDASSTHGPWTRGTLTLIEAHPATLAATLAERLGRERLAFKADVRKLKALGLTISLETGYRISARGRAVLRRLERHP
jgi:hypothetical protein